jgi:hypothetical protein
MAMPIRQREAAIPSALLIANPVGMIAVLLGPGRAQGSGNLAANRGEAEPVSRMLLEV